MKDHGLNDNAAQVACLQCRDMPEAPSLVVGNIHVLFNQKRGDVKLGQVFISDLSFAFQSFPDMEADFVFQSTGGMNRIPLHKQTSFKRISL